MELLQRLASRKIFARLKKSLRKYSIWLDKRPSVFIIVGLFIFLFGASRYYQIRVLSFSNVPPATLQGQSLQAPVPVQITIPSINIDEPIDVGTIKDGVWQISYDHPTFLDSSASPGTGGNVVIYGHNKKVIFGNLPYLSLGQKIIIKTADGKTYIYEAYWKDFVSSDRVDLVSPENKEDLTIYTCWGLFDSQRVVVKAKLL